METGRYHEALSFFIFLIKEQLMERVYVVCNKPYGCMSFIFDILMTVITGGFWLIWIFIREMRKR